MGLDISLSVVYAFRVERSLFFRTTGTQLRCPNDHDLPDDNYKFCPACGRPTVPTPIEDPTPALVGLSEKLTYSPTRTFSLLLDSGVHLEGVRGTVRIFSLGLFCSSEDDVAKSVLGLGFELMRAYSAPRKPDFSGVPTSLLADLAEDLQTIRRVFGVPPDAEAKIYPSVYLFD